MAVHRVAVLLLPGVLPLDAGIPLHLFGFAAGYELTVCADPDLGDIRSCGVEFRAAAGLEALRVADTVIVPGYEDPDLVLGERTIDALVAAHAVGARMVSICSGAFALAAAGILDGRRATTHWQLVESLRRRHPRVRVEDDALFVDDGEVLTSAGVTAGIDLCLHIVRNDLGAAAANSRARALVAPPRRAGGQSQFVERFRPDDRGGDLAATREWLLADLARPSDLDAMARHATMSRRTFVRRFRAETACSPQAWLTRARIDRARELLETTSVPIERLGELTGLGSPAATRAAFQRHVGTSPREYRRAFTTRITAAS